LLVLDRRRRKVPQETEVTEETVASNEEVVE